MEIDKLYTSIRNNFEPVVQYFFMRVITFDFKVDSIVEYIHITMQYIDPGILVWVQVRPRNTILCNPEPEPALDLFRFWPRANSRRPVRN